MPRTVPACACAQCGLEAVERTSSVVWFTESSFTLARCPGCEQVLDPYVEFDLVITSLDLALHRFPAYRHLLLNNETSNSVWLRLYLMAFVILLLRGIWVDAPFYSVFLVEFAQFTLVAGLYLVLCSKTQHHYRTWPVLLKAIILGKWPAFLLIVGWAWEFALVFHMVIEFYMCTATSAALSVVPGLNARKAVFMSVLGTLASVALQISV